VEYIEKIGRDRIAEHEHQLLALATDHVTAVPGLRIIGTAPLKASVLSFVMEGVHPHDIGTVLDSEGVCIRAGHHCAQPLMKRLDVPATARASFALYNQESDVDALVGALQQTRRLFG
jgi:cysteine desulfurase/selenocysteine lyase